MEVPEGYFRDLYLVYADRGFAGTDYPHYYCVFKEKTTSDHYFVEVLMSPSGFKPLKKEKIGFAVQEDMPFAVSFTTSAIFYGVGNELYCYDTGNGRSVSCYNEFGSGAVYEGEWVKNQRSGKGHYKWGNGDESPAASTSSIFTRKSSLISCNTVTNRLAKNNIPG